MGKSTNRDLTVGSPMRLIIQFFIPVLLGMLFQQFYNIMDTMIVGRILGPTALAAVGGTGAFNFMVIGFCMGVCSGFAIPVANSFGAKDEVNLKKYVANSVWMTCMIAFTMTITICSACRTILSAMHTPTDIFEDSFNYIFIIFAGIPIVYLYNLLSGILRALGDSKTPLYFLILSSLLNIIFDLIFILIFHMGVSGAAAATVLAQAISGILCLVYIRENFKILRLTRQEWRLSRSHIKNLWNMGIPMGLQYTITAIGSVILQTAVNELGAMVVAAITAGSKVSLMFCCVFDALGATMATYAGQNTGAGKFSRVTQGIKACSTIAIIYSMVALFIIYMFGEKICLLFLDPKETEIISHAVVMLKWISAFYIPLAYVNILRFTIQGMGASQLAIVAGICEMVARAVIGFVFVPILGYVAACIASPTAWVAADLFLFPAYFYVLKGLKKSKTDEHSYHLYEDIVK